MLKYCTPRTVVVKYVLYVMVFPISVYNAINHKNEINKIHFSVFLCFPSAHTHTHTIPPSTHEPLHTHLLSGLLIPLNSHS